MKPEEKAKEVIEKFVLQLKTATPSLNRPYHQAKSCALICVDEILKELPKTISSSIDINGQTNPRWKFWTEVKSFIENS